MGRHGFEVVPPYKPATGQLLLLLAQHLFAYVPKDSSQLAEPKRFVAKMVEDQRNRPAKSPTELQH
jgi:hypothetical protein